MTWRAVAAHQLTQNFDHPLRAQTTGDIVRQTFTRVFIDYRQTLDLLRTRAAVKHKIARPDLIHPTRRQPRIWWVSPIDPYFLVIDGCPR